MTPGQKAFVRASVALDIAGSAMIKAEVAIESIKRELGARGVVFLAKLRGTTRTVHQLERAAFDAELDAYPPQRGPYFKRNSTEARKAAKRTRKEPKRRASRAKRSSLSPAERQHRNGTWKGHHQR